MIRNYDVESIDVGVHFGTINGRHLFGKLGVNGNVTLKEIRK
jgi:hypothetical protein